MIKSRDRVVVVTRKTALEELVERFNTRDQARFYIEHMGGRFDDYQAAHDAYHAAVEHVREAMPRRARSQWIDRSFLPTFDFEGDEVVVVLGQDGLVVNAAKYLDDQVVVAMNPDPERVDGVLLPFSYLDASSAIERARFVRGRIWREVTMARADLNDGQSLLAVNDLFIGQKTHASARYRLRFDGREEDQSSSGIIVSTGAGSTGWHRSILTGAAGIVGAYVDDERVRDLRDRYRFDWEARYLVFHVREPFISRTSGAELVQGRIGPESPLEIASHMPQNGVIFGDGVEEDRVDFNSGAIARIGLAERTLRLVVPEGAAP
jgi:NAD kinase